MIYKNNGYVYGVSNKEVDEESRNTYEIIKNKPKPQVGYDYRLKEDLTWELFKMAQSTETTETDKPIEKAVTDNEP